MSRALLAYVDAVVAASVPLASRALAPVVQAAEQAIRDAGGYDEADAALQRLEAGVRGGRLQQVLEGAIRNGTSAGAAS